GRGAPPAPPPAAPPRGAAPLPAARGPDEPVFDEPLFEEPLFEEPLFEFAPTPATALQPPVELVAARGEELDEETVEDADAAGLDASTLADELDAELNDDEVLIDLSRDLAGLSP